MKSEYCNCSYCAADKKKRPKAAWSWEIDGLTHKRWLHRGVCYAADIYPMPTLQQNWSLHIYTSVSDRFIDMQFSSLDEAKSYADNAIKSLGYKTIPDYMRTLI